MSVFELHRGTSPVVLAFPHTGTFVPPEIEARLNEEGRVLRDTDWHIHLLYEGLLPGASTMRATFHRYCIDANRDPAGATLYPGQNTTGLVPTTNFDGVPIWREREEPGEADIAERLRRFHAPYHEALRAEVARVRNEHGVAVVYDCHSIRSRVPFLFEGRLPDLNIGTDGGRTCDPAIERAVLEASAEATCYSHVLNGRFRGGWTTRVYGEPALGIHAVQMELAQVSHLTEEAPPFVLDEARALRLRPVLNAVLTRIEAVAHFLKERSA